MQNNPPGTSGPPRNTGQEQQQSRLNDLLTTQLNLLSRLEAQCVKFNDLLTKQGNAYDRLGTSLTRHTDLLTRQVSVQDRLNTSLLKGVANLASLTGGLNKFGDTLTSVLKKVTRATQEGAAVRQPRPQSPSSPGMYLGTQPFPMMLPGGSSSGSTVTRELVDATVRNVVKVDIVRSVLLPTLGAKEAVAAGEAGSARGSLGRMTLDYYLKHMTATLGVPPIVTHGKDSLNLAQYSSGSSRKPFVGNADDQKSGDAAKGLDALGKTLKGTDWTEMAQRVRTVGQALTTLDPTFLDLGKNVESAGNALTAFGGPKMQAVGAAVGFVGGMIDKLGAEGRRQRTLVVGAFADMTRSMRSFGVTASQVMTTTLGEGLRRAAEASTPGGFYNSAQAWGRRIFASLADAMPWSAGGNLRAVELTTLRNNMVQNQQNLQALRTDPVLRGLNQQLGIGTLSGNLLAGVEQNANRVVSGRAGVTRLNRGGTQAQARDSASLAAQFDQMSRIIDLPVGQLMVMFDPMIRQVQAMQRMARGVQFAQESIVRNQMPLEVAGRRRNALAEAGNELSPEQRNREAGDIFRDLAAAAGPLNRLSQAFMQFTPEAQSAVNRAEREQLGADPAAQAVQVSRALLEQARQQTDWNRRAALALEQNFGPPGGIQ